MQYYRCKCGSVTAWTSMGVAPCTSCKKCGSDLAQGPEGHAESPAPHEYVTRYDQTTGKPYEVCSVCMGKKEEIEKPLPPEPPAPPPPDPHELAIHALNKRVGIAPHCDDLVLHRAEACDICGDDKFLPLHAYRKEHNINYTGEEDASKVQCPATKRRSAATIHQWGGNRPKT